MSEKPYKYERPIDGQPEERWWASLSTERRTAIKRQVDAGIRARRDRWNATHEPKRRIPREDDAA